MNSSPTQALIVGGQQGQRVDASQSVVPPDLSKPLINEPAQANPVVTPVGPLQNLIGTWTNQNLGSSMRGGPENPFSYNLMILPQSPTADPADPTQSPFGYILKSMSYYEEITFSQIHGAAANRGGTGSQISNALLYEQRVYISNGPAEDTLVHFENGIFSFLTPMAQALGPYGDGDGTELGMQTFGTAPPPLAYNIFKQISVPHGNSVLACGNMVVDAKNNAVPQKGPLDIAPPPQVLPTGIDTSVYSQANVQNLNPTYAQNPNQALNDALAVSPAAQFITISVDSANGGGGVGNIDYEQERADVSAYSATYWLEDLTGDGNYTQLQYSQTIMLKIPITLPGASEPTDIFFPHITTNTLTKVGS